MKKLVRFTAFLLIAAVIFCSLDRLLTRKTLDGWWNITTKTHGFFNTEEDTLDVVFCGSSHAYSSFNPLLIGEETGLSCYTIATQKQPLWATYYYIKEAIERQHPSLIVMDLFAFSLTDEYADEATNYTFTDDFPFGINKLNMIKYAAAPEDRFDLLFKLTKYHTRWSELTNEDFSYNPKELRDYLYGYCMLTATERNIVPNNIGTALSIPSSDKNELWLGKIITLCKENNTNLLLVKTPMNDTSEERGYFMRAAELAEKEGVPCILYNEYFDEIGLSFETDFYDRGHLNWLGADKFSRYFANTALTDITPKGTLDKRFEENLRRYKTEYENLNSNRS